MGIAARILVVSDDTENALPSTLREFGFESNIAKPEAEAGALLQPGASRPDVVILDMLSACANKHPRDYLGFVRQLKNSEATARLPVIVLGDRDALSAGGGEEMQHANVDEVLFAPVSGAQLCGRVNSLIRLNVMHDELVRRLNTSAQYGVDAPANVAPPRMVSDATILVVGATRDFPAIEQSLSKDATLVGALTATTALDYMARRNFDAVIVDLNGDPAPFLEMARAARRNSQLYNTPILLLAPEDALENSEAPFANGYTDVLFKPINQTELNRRVMSFVRELRFRDSLRHIYSQARHMATSDGLTGLYSKGFLLEHLRSMLRDTIQRQDEMSLAFLEIRNMAAINDRFGYVIGDRIIRQAGEMMGMLVRGEDLSARYSGPRFVVALPGTAPKFADIAVRRIVGVINFTEFSVPGINEAIHVELTSGVTGCQGDDTPETIIERARQRSRA